MRDEKRSKDVYFFGKEKIIFLTKSELKDDLDYLYEFENMNKIKQKIYSYFNKNKINEIEYKLIQFFDPYRVCQSSFWHDFEDTDPACLFRVKFLHLQEKVKNKNLSFNKLTDIYLSFNKLTNLLNEEYLKNKDKVIYSKLLKETELILNDIK